MLGRGKNNPTNSMRVLKSDQLALLKDTVIVITSLGNVLKIFGIFLNPNAAILVLLPSTQLKLNRSFKRDTVIGKPPNICR